jgi:hypothetical protein
MPDTGAPWNIPYVAPSDLVRDYPSDSEDLADAIALGLSAAGNPGIGSNVVQTVKTNTFSTSSTSFITVTGFSASITPSTATSKVFIIVDAKLGQNATSNNQVMIRVTGGNAGTYVGDADGSRIRAAGSTQTYNFDASIASVDTSYAVQAVYLDSPATASSVTYTVEMRASTGTGFLNRANTDGSTANIARNASSITLIEVAP